MCALVQVDGPSLRRGFVTELARVGGQLTLRVDPKYRFLADKENQFPVESGANTRRLRFRDCILPYVPRVVPKGRLERPRRLLELADVEGRTSIIVGESGGELRLVEEVGSSKLDFADCDMVVSRLRPYLGKIVLNDPADPFVGTSEWIPFKLNREVLNPLFAKYLLLLPGYLEALRDTMSGKEHPRTSEGEIARLLVPLPSSERQAVTARRLSELERQMIDAYRHLRTRAELVNEVFGREFGYDPAKLSAEVPNSVVYPVGRFGASLDLRTGVRFHSARFNALHSVLARIPTTLLRDFVVRPVRLGATIHPSDYDDDGQARYISPAAIRTYVIELDSARAVTDAFYQANVRRSGVRAGDVLIARSGEGTIGKAALVQPDLGPAIYSDFTMRVRARRPDSAEFLYYYCCSQLFSLQVEQIKRGMGNMTNFFPSQLLRFRVANPPEPQKVRLVEEVRKALGERDKQREQLEALRDQIDRAILQAIAD